MPLDGTMTNAVAYVLGVLIVALFGLLGIIVTAVQKGRSESKEARHEASQARQGINAIEENTSMLSDGFAYRVERKLTSILATSERMERRLDAVENNVRSHLEWHVGRHRKDPR